jgi:hypothetical protein
MIPNGPDPVRAAARAGSGNDVCFGGEQFPDSAPPKTGPFVSPKAMLSF